jgi:hypothetical protein
MPITHTRELDSTPNLTMLFGKAVLTGFSRHGDSLPSTVYSRDGIVVDPTHLSAYNKVCGYRLTDELPITYPHIISFPLQIKLMTDGDFPFPLVGSVHLANRITQFQPLRADSPLKLRVHVEDLREHVKGRQFDMVTEAFVAGSLVWRGVSTYLHRTGSGSLRPGCSGFPAPSHTVCGQKQGVWLLLRGGFPTPTPSMSASKLPSCCHQRSGSPPRGLKTAGLSTCSTLGPANLT